jgi:hypothetical protein
MPIARVLTPHPRCRSSIQVASRVPVSATPFPEESSVSPGATAPAHPSTLTTPMSTSLPSTMPASATLAPNPVCRVCSTAAAVLPRPLATPAPPITPHQCFDVRMVVHGGKNHLARELSSPHSPDGRRPPLHPQLPRCRCGPPRPCPPPTWHLQGTHFPRGCEREMCPWAISKYFGD